MMIALVLIISYRYSLKNRENISLKEEKKEAPPVIYFLTVLAFVFYVCFEVIVSNWMNTYIEKYCLLSTQYAANSVTLFFVCLASSRIFCAFFAREERVKLYLFLFLSLAFLGYFLGILINPFFLGFVGLAGPYFPLMLNLMHQRFPHTKSSKTFYLFFFIHLFLFFSNILYTKISGLFSHGFAFLIPGVCFLLMIPFALKMLYYKEENNFL